MSYETTVNTILSQSHAIKEMYNSKKQEMEMNQQRNAKDITRKVKENKAKVNKTETENKLIKIKDDPNKNELRKRNKKKENQKQSDRKKVDIRI